MTNIRSPVSPVMDGSLPTSLKHIISNAEYYGPSLFLLGEHTEQGYLWFSQTVSLSVCSAVAGRKSFEQISGGGDGESVVKLC